MLLPVWVTLLISFLTDFILAGGSALGAGAVGASTFALPSKGVWIMALVAGLMAGARRLQALVAPSITAPPQGVKP